MKITYYQNKIDVTWYVINNAPLPMSTRFFPVEKVISK